MWIRIFAGIISYEAIVLSILQSDIMSDSLMRILEQFPVLGVILIVMYYMQKAYREDAKETNARLEHMLEAQRVNLKEIYETNKEGNRLTYEVNQTFLSTLIAQIEAKQTRMSDRIELLTQQLAINTSTVNEIAKVDSIISELIARLEEK